MPSQREVTVTEKSFSSKSFGFNRVFCTASGQDDVFRSVASPLIKQVLKGYNATIFAYGQTGTGKTYTMEGLREDVRTSGRWEEDPDAGIIPRSLIEIFETKKKRGLDDNSCQIKVSFLELYNEEIFDLLSKHFDPDRKQ